MMEPFITDLVNKVSEAVPAIMAQSWLWGSQIAVKKNKVVILSTH